MSLLHELSGTDDTTDFCRRCKNSRTIVEARAERAVASRCPDCFSVCDTCRGTGFVFTKDWTGAPVSTQCSCRQVDRHIALYNRAAVPRRYILAELEQGTEDTTESFRAARVAAWRLTREFTPGDVGLGLSGPVGCGKTHLMAALLRELTLVDGVPSRFIEFTHLLTELKQGFETGEGTSGLMDELVSVPVLVIDELGKGLSTEWQRTILDELISKRYNRQVTTLFTTNYPYELTTGKAKSREGFEVTSLQDRVGARIASRLAEMCAMRTVDAPDYRLARVSA